MSNAHEHVTIGRVPTLLLVLILGAVVLFPRGASAQSFLSYNSLDGVLKGYIYFDTGSGHTIIGGTCESDNYTYAEVGGLCLDGSGSCYTAGYPYPWPRPNPFPWRQTVSCTPSTYNPYYQFDLGELTPGPHTFSTFTTTRYWGGGQQLDYLTAGAFSYTACVRNTGQGCAGATNSCGDAGGGYIACDGSCVAAGPAPPERWGNNRSCTLYSAPNNGGAYNTSTGQYDCSMSCIGTAPAAPADIPNLGQSCNFNSCGTPGGVIVPSADGRSGVCSGGTPANPSYLNQSCSSPSNSCGDTYNGTFNCSYVCSAGYSPPPERAGYGSACSTAPNSCGDRNYGYIQCDGSCSVSTAPAERSNYNATCTLTSAPNACGKTATANGTLDCNGVCTGTTPAPPSNATCAPGAPTVSGLYNNTGYLGSSVPAYDSSGYQLYAQGVSPAGFNLTYYFEWSKDGVNWTGDPGLPAGSWAVLP